nr:hypothetical protein [Segatella maculosa]
MKGFKYILAGCAMLAFGSCGDFLKEYSQDTDYVRSWRDLDELLIGSAYQPVCCRYIINGFRPSILPSFPRR